VVAGVPAWGLELGAGATFSYALSFSNDYVPATQYYNGTLNHIVLGAYFDAFFARVTVMYITNVGNPVSYPSFSAGNLWTTQIGFSVLAKLPVVVKSVTLWSGIGGGFLTTLMLDYNGDGINDKDPNGAYDDIYLLLAAGAELKLWNLITVGPSFTLNYDLTPGLYPGEPSGSSHTRLFFQFTVSLGFAF
jgi:hypothetical protein